MIKYILIFILGFNVLTASVIQKDEDIVQEILTEEKHYNMILKKVKETEQNIKENKEKLSKSKETLEELNTTAKILNGTKQRLESDIVKLVSKKYALTTAVKNEYKTTEQNTINRELFKVILNNAKKQITKLNSDYTTISDLIDKNKERTLNLYTSIDNLESKKEKYTKQKEQQKQYLIALKRKREINNQRLKELELKNKTNKTKQKTIAPLKNYTITKKFGTYFDEQQNMEMFNESLHLRSKKRNAKVYNVLSGKIVYVKKNSNILGNVVIVKNKDGIYTIYSNLRSIFKSIKSGKNIKSGAAIGRISRVLKFKVTKNTTYIDPMIILNP